MKACVSMVWYAKVGCKLQKGIDILIWEIAILIPAVTYAKT
jgi:hypothetical protein